MKEQQRYHKDAGTVLFVHVHFDKLVLQCYHRNKTDVLKCRVKERHLKINAAKSLESLQHVFFLKHGPWSQSCQHLFILVLAEGLLSPYAFYSINIIITTFQKLGPNFGGFSSWGYLVPEVTQTVENVHILLPCGAVYMYTRETSAWRFMGMHIHYK